MSDPQLITICAWCRRLRRTQDDWVEADTRGLPESQITHGICPRCLEDENRRQEGSSI